MKFAPWHVCAIVPDRRFVEDRRNFPAIRSTDTRTAFRGLTLDNSRFD
ncbi:MAG: hypothetical protein ACREPZ_12085 [Rhodanobacteraceae bacterium]